MSECIKARVSPWLRDERGRAGTVTFIEGKPAAAAQASVIEMAMITLADEVLTAQGRAHHSDPDAAVRISIESKPSAWN